MKNDQIKGGWYLYKLRHEAEVNDNPQLDFRVWSFMTNSWITDLVDCVDKYGNVYLGLKETPLKDLEARIKDYDYTIDRIWTYHDVLVTWSTGRKDITGKIIYQGDIVFIDEVPLKYKAFNEIPKEKRYDEFYFEIQKYKSGFTPYSQEMLEQEGEGAITSMDTEKEMLIIGNIFQNTNFLKKEHIKIGRKWIDGVRENYKKNHNL